VQIGALRLPGGAPGIEITNYGVKGVVDNTFAVLDEQAANC
jgi:hypothetical protein